MPFIAKETSGSHLPPIEPGVYVGVCYGLIDLGTHHNDRFNRDARKVLIQWEIPDVRMDVERDGKNVNLPRVISERFTVSLSEKASLRKALESWRGRKFTAEELRGFDLRTIIGKACQLQVIHEQSKDGTRTFAKVSAIMAIPRGLPPPKPENAISFFTFDEAETPVLPDLPEWVVGIVQESVEWKALIRAIPQQGDGFDEAFGPAAAMPSTPPTDPGGDESADDDGPVPF
jgi:hypothetical protein